MFQFQLLANNILEFMDKIFPVCSMIGFKQDITNALTEKRLEELAITLQYTENSDILKYLTRLLSMFVVDDYSVEQSQLVIFQLPFSLLIV